MNGVVPAPAIDIIGGGIGPPGLCWLSGLREWPALSTYLRDQLQSALGAAYTLERELGGAGMSRVYAALEPSLGRAVVVKVLPPELATQLNAERFRREVRLLALLHHPHIVPLLAAGEVGELLYYVMPYIEGESLRDRITRERRLPLEDALCIAREVADALAFAHRHGVVHRDIKPENILLEDRHAVVGDFGIARAMTRAAGDTLTATGLTIGTPTYMSPEQAGAEGEVDGRADIYSVGCVLYEMLAGVPPYTAPSTRALVAKIFLDPVPSIRQARPDAPEAVERVITRALAKLPVDRHQSAGDLRDALSEILREVEPKQSHSESRSALCVAPPAAAAVGAGATRPHVHEVPVNNGLGADPRAEAREGVERLNRKTTSTVQCARPSGAAVDESASRSTPWRWGSLGVLAALVTVGLLGAITVALNDGRSPRLLGGGAGAPIRSIAVLPLANLSGDSRQEYFADGMTDALITDLAQIGSLRVISRTSVTRYKGRGKALPEIARELGVDAIVEGSVLRDGGRVRISVQLIRAATDAHLWAETYERDLREMLPLQREIARRVANSVQVTLTPQEHGRLSATRSVDPTAYDYYLRGKFQSYRVNRVAIDSSIALLERAVAIDPGFAVAHGALGLAYMLKSLNFAPQERLWERRAFAAAERALALDSSVADAYVIRGRLVWTPNSDWQHEQAIREFRRALAVNPSSDEAHYYLALIFGHIGLLDEALRESRTALAINPSHIAAHSNIAQALLYSGRYEEALAVLRKIPGGAGQPVSRYQTVWALFLVGRRQEAAQTIERFLREDTADVGGLLASTRAVVLAADGRALEAEREIKRARSKGEGKAFVHFHHAAYSISEAYALLGKRDQAVRWLQTAAEDGFPCYPLFARDPTLESLRGDPRFADFMAKLRTRWESYRRALTGPASDG